MVMNLFPDGNSFCGTARDWAMFNIMREGKGEPCVKYVVVHVSQLLRILKKHLTITLLNRKLW